MSSFDFSPEQQQAIASRGENLLVAAGAGSGKTSVLVERIIRRLSDREHPGSLQRLLVLTFTNAAAADMRAKIHGALTAMVKAEPDNRHILQELHQLPQASIGTLHSFCLNLLRRYYYRLELDGGFRIARETELVLLEDEVLENYLEQQYGQENGQAQALADAYGGGRDDRQLVELIQELYQFSRSQPHPEQWLQQACAFDGESLDDYPFAPFLRRYLQKQGEIAGVYLAQAAELARSAPELLPEGWLWALKEELAGVNCLAAGGDLVSLLSTLHALEFQPLRGGKKDHNQPFRQEFKNLRNQGREEIKELQQRFGLGKPAQLLADLRALSVLTEPLARFTCEYGQALSTEKRKRNLIDFGDMEHLAYALLQQEDIAQELQQGFDEVLIDEYQDINAVQEEILRLVQTGNNCFAVGDVKQSIYRFRLAEPSLFLDKYAAYGKLTGGRRIDLNRNYRSTGGVIDGINYIFGQLMSMPIAEMDYDQAASLKAGREEYGQPTELLLADLSGNAPRESGEAAESSNEEEEGAENEDLDALTAETRLIGGRIRQLLTEGYTLDEMAVLLRTAKNRVAVVARELNAMGIAAVADQQDSFLKAPEIVLLLSLLKIIDNPRQDIALGAVLRSPLAGFTPEQLVEIRLAAKGDFYLAFTACAAKEGELADRCRDFLTRLTAWRELARKEKISVLLRQLWQDTGIYHLAGALSDGKRRQANLDAFYAQACVYEAEDYRGLYRFIRFLEQVRDKGRELPAVYPQPQKAAVRIMSIHRSKGLEFKVVFVAGLGCRFHGAGGQQDLLWHKDLGLGPKVANREQRIKYPSLAYQAIAAKLRGETAAEELRIFYVALTRAR
ncbi:MAG: helicase-exonuclease AddAB subunit AddA, partial [Clostridiales bacterium]